jgi:hypothetical protein
MYFYLSWVLPHLVILCVSAARGVVCSGTTDRTNVSITAMCFVAIRIGHYPYNNPISVQHDPFIHP